MSSSEKPLRQGFHILFSYGLVGRGGDAVQVLSYAEAFRGLGHNVHLVGPQALQPYEFASKSGRLRSWLRQRPWWARDMIELGLNVMTFYKARRFMQHHEVDLIFDRAGIYGFVGARLATNQRHPLIAHLDAPFPLERAFRGEGYFRRIHRLAMRSIGQKAQLVVTVSRASCDYFVQIGLPADKIVVQPNGISRALLERGMNLAKVHQPFANGQPYTIGFVGSLTRWHRVDLLLEALHLSTAQKADGFRLVVVGYGEEYERLVKRAHELGVQDWVRWVGPMSQEQAFAQIAQFDIAVLPHTLSTGSPLKLFEYAALARPFIVPDLPNIRDLFEEDEVYFIQPQNPQVLANKLIELVSNPDVAVQTGRRAQEQVKKHTWEQYVENLIERIALWSNANRGISQR